MPKRQQPIEPTSPLVAESVALRALPPRSWLWLRIAVVVVALGVVGAVAGHLLDRPPVLWGSIVGALVIAVPLVVFGARNHARGQQLDGVIEAANAILQASAPTRELVKASRWRDGWIGYPERLRMRYPSPLVDNDPKFVAGLTAQVSNRMGVPYELRKNDPKRRVLVLERARAVADKPTAVQESMDQVSSVVGSMLPGARVTALTQDDANELVSLEFAWPASVMTRAVSPVFQGRIAKTLQATLGVPLSVHFDAPSQTARAVPLTPLPNIIPHPPRNTKTPMRVEFGQFRDGRMAVWDLDGTLPHLLIVGGTGGGKTVLLWTLISALPSNVRVTSVDPKKVGLQGTNALPNVSRPAIEPVAMVDAILAFKDRMDARYDKLVEIGTHMRKTFDPEVLVIDEGQELVDMLNNWWMTGEGKTDWQERYGLPKPPTGTKHPIMGAVDSILRLGREARMHVILSSQQAAAEWLKTSSRGQFAVRIALRNLASATDSIMVFGTPNATNGLESVSGRAWVSLGAGMQPEHAQIFWTPKVERNLSPEDRAILEGLGVEIPAEHADAAAETAPVEPVDVAATRPIPAPPIGEEPADDADEMDAPADSDVGVLTSVLDLDDGMRVLIDIDGELTPATVESLEPDDASGDGYLLLSYVTENGVPGALSVADTEQVQTLDPVAA